MNYYSWWRRMRRPVAAGALAGALVLVAVFAYIVTRPSTYQARFTLVASTAADNRSNETLESLVNITLASLPELARSSAVLDRVGSRVEGTPDSTELAPRIQVELVPPSGVARISVQDTDPTRAAQTSAALSDELLSLDLLRPAGQFRSFDAGAPVLRTAPDSRLAVGFGLAAGVMAALLVGFLVAARTPRITSRGQVSRLVSGDVPVLSAPALSDLGETAERLLIQSRAHLLPADAAASEACRATRDAGPWQEEPCLQGNVVIVATLGVATTEGLTNALCSVRARGGQPMAILLVNAERRTKTGPHLTQER